jgi:hypothetical protein
MDWAKISQKTARTKNRSIKRKRRDLPGRLSRHILTKRAETTIMKMETARAPSQRGTMTPGSGWRIKQIREERKMKENAAKVMIKDGLNLTLVTSKFLLNPSPEEICHDAQKGDYHQKNESHGKKRLIVERSSGHLPHLAGYD